MFQQHFLVKFQVSFFVEVVDIVVVVEVSAPIMCNVVKLFVCKPKILLNLTMVFVHLRELPLVEVFTEFV